MKTKRILQAVTVVVALSIPCYAIRLMMFNNIDQYIERAAGIWIVEVVKDGEERQTKAIYAALGPVYEVKVLQTLKGNPEVKTLAMCVLSRQLVR